MLLGMINPLVCTVCDEPLLKHRNYVAAFALQGGGLALRYGSVDTPLPNLELATAVFPSQECLVHFVNSWANSLSVTRKH